MLTTAIQDNSLYYTIHHTQYDRLSQQQLSLLFLVFVEFTVSEHCSNMQLIAVCFLCVCAL